MTPYAFDLSAPRQKSNVVSPFNWRGQPSQLSLSTKKITKPNLEPKRLHLYSVATASDRTRESEIAQVNREVERHFALAQTVDDLLLRGHHRDEARRLAARVKALVAMRPAAYVAAMETCYFAEQGDLARKAAE